METWFDYSTCIKTNFVNHKRNLLYTKCNVVTTPVLSRERVVRLLDRKVAFVYIYTPAIWRRPRIDQTDKLHYTKWTRFGLELVSGVTEV